MANDADSGKKPKKDMDNINLEDVRAPQRSGSSAIWWVILVIILAAVAWYGVDHVKKQQKAAAAEAKVEAAAVRQAQVSQAEANISEAITQAEQGNIAAALAKLQVAENQFGLIVTNANRDDDQAAANDALDKKRAVMDARKAREDEQAKFQTAVTAQLDALRSRFNIAAKATTEPAAETTAPSASEAAPSATPSEEGASPAPSGEAVPPSAPAPSGAG
jgi:hypothetical protein